MSKKMCPPECNSCYLDESGKQPAVEWFDSPPGRSWEIQLLQSEMILIIKGSLSFSFDQFFDRIVSKGEMVLFAAGSKVKVRTRTGASGVILRFKEIEKLCEGLPMENLQIENSEFVYDLNTLKINLWIKNFLESFRENYENGLDCQQYSKMKINELFFMLKSYYPKKELAAFLYPLLSNNNRFMNFVLQNYQGVKKASEFAEKYGCSTSSFEKKFRHTFGITPYQWMKEKRMKQIYQELNSTSKPLRQIAKEQNFLSHSQFTDYCKKHFGHPPGKIRQLTGVPFYKTEKN